jgi:hypothetical protein
MQPSKQTYKMYGSVDGRNQDEQCVNTATRRKEKEVAEVGVVEMATACVDPWTVMVHFHYTSVAKRK